MQSTAFCRFFQTVDIGSIFEFVEFTFFPDYIKIIPFSYIFYWLFLWNRKNLANPNTKNNAFVSVILSGEKVNLSQEWKKFIKKSNIRNGGQNIN